MSGGRMRLKRMRDSDELDFPSQSASRRSRQEEEESEEGEHEIIFERPAKSIANNQSNNQSTEQEEGYETDAISLPDESSLDDFNREPLSPTIQQFIKPVTSRITVEPLKSVAANSDQSTEARRALGSIYKQLQDATRSDVELLENDEGISRGLQLTNELNRRTAHVTEELQDAEELAVLSEKGISKAKKRLAHGPLIDYKVYCSCFFARYGRPADTADEGASPQVAEVDWIAAGFEASRFGSIPPLGGATITHFDLFGVHPVKQRTVAVRREKEELKHSTAAQGTKLALEASQTDERVKTLTALFKKVTRNGPVQFWVFLVDPYSFVGTVENVFDFSFIVKDHCRMTWHDKDTERLFPLIQYKEANSNEVDSSQSTQSTQPTQPQIRRGKREASAADRVAHCTVTLDHERWRGLIEAFDIREPMIPSRYARKQRQSAANKRRQTNVSQSQQDNGDEEEEEEDEENVDEGEDEHDNEVDNDDDE